MHFQIICATLHLHQISGMIFSLCFNAHGNPQPGFHFWISFAFSAKIYSDFWWSYPLTAAFSDTWHCYSYSFIGQLIRYFWIYTLFALSFYTQNVKIYSESFHVRFVQRGDLWKQTTRQLQMGYNECNQIDFGITYADFIYSIWVSGFLK